MNEIFERYAFLAKKRHAERSPLMSSFSLDQRLVVSFLVRLRHRVTVQLGGSLTRQSMSRRDVYVDRSRSECRQGEKQSCSLDVFRKGKGRSKPKKNKNFRKRELESRGAKLGCEDFGASKNTEESLMLSGPGPVREDKVRETRSERPATVAG